LKNKEVIMAMGVSTGKFRALKTGENAEVGEVEFAVKEKVEIKGCLFEVTGIDPDPENRMSLKGVPKPPKAQEAPATGGDAGK